MNIEPVVNEISFEAIVGYPTPQLETEIWTQDSEDENLWHGPAGVIVNTAALEERRAFYQILTRE